MAMYLMTTNGRHDIELEPYSDINEVRKQAKKCYGHLTKEELRHGADIEIWLDVDEDWEENGNLDHNLDEELEAWKAEHAERTKKMEEYKITQSEISRGFYNQRTLDEVRNHFNEMGLHYYCGGDCDTAEKWERRLTADDIMDEGQYGYEEDVLYEGGDPYSYDTDNHDYPPIYEDGEAYQIVKIILPDGSGEYYGLTCGGDLIYG